MWKVTRSPTRNRDLRVRCRAVACGILGSAHQSCPTSRSLPASTFRAGAPHGTLFASGVGWTAAAFRQSGYREKRDAIAVC
jgi:hypothetical protein